MRHIRYFLSEGHDLVDKQGTRLRRHVIASSGTLNRPPSPTLEQVLEYVDQGGTGPDARTTLAGRLARLQREFTPAQLAELKALAGGKSFPALAIEPADFETGWFGLHGSLGRAHALFGDKLKPLITELNTRLPA